MIYRSIWDCVMRSFQCLKKASQHFLKRFCGTSWQRRETVVVPDVEKFPGHIACSSESRSEIVVPVFKADKVCAVLDIDSKYLNTFDKTDASYLEQIVKLLN